MSLKHQIFSGVLWSAFARVGQQLAQIGLSIILTRLLLPRDFGLIGMTMVFTGFVNIFADGGFNSALVQREVIDDEHVHSVFWLNVGLGILLFLGMCLSAPWIAKFYANPQLTLLTIVLSSGMMINSFGMVPAALLQRKMRFDVLAKVSVISTVLSGIIGVVWAFTGHGVWALVLQNISAVLLTTFLSCVLQEWRPKLVFRMRAIKDLWNYTANLFGFTFINYWSRSGDNLIVGKAFGAAELGNYNRAYFFMVLPISQVIGAMSQVMLPALASVQSDRERVKKIYLRSMSVIALISFPIMTGLMITARPFILTVYGPRWAGVIPLLCILAPVGMMQALSNPMGWIYTSQGRTDKLLRWGSAYSFTLILFILLGAFLGSTRGIAISYAVGNLLLLYPWLAVSGKIIDMSVKDIAKSVSGPFFGSLTMGLLVFLVLMVLPTGWRPWQQLCVLAVVGICTYLTFVMGLRIAAWKDLTDTVREKLESRRSDKAVANVMI